MNGVQPSLNGSNTVQNISDWAYNTTSISLLHETMTYVDRITSSEYTLFAKSEKQYVEL